jgi:uncharacterized membrane protein YfcA
MVEWLSLALLGFGTATFGVMVGTGGGIILVPMLLLFFDLEPETAAGTSLTLVAMNSFAGSYTYTRLGFVDKRSALLFAAVAIPGSVLAPFVVANIGGDLFRLLFGILLVALAAQILIRSYLPTRVKKPKRMHSFRSFIKERQINTKRGQRYRYHFNEPAATSINFAIGFVSAFFGTGGGFLRTPLLVTVFNFPVRVAVATSVFALSFYATAGSVAHASLGHVDWFPTVIFAGIGILIGGQVGARIAVKLKGVWILRLLVLILVVMGGQMLFEGLLG